jgi:hypothetical protein
MICLIKNLKIKMKIKKIIIFNLLIFLSISIECKIQVTDFCTKIEIEGNTIECNGDFGLSCDKNTCSKDQFSCQGLKLFSSAKQFKGFGKKYDLFIKICDLFISQIKNCTIPEYKWNPNHVCLNIKVSFQVDSSGVKLKKMEPDECSEKYNIKCNNYYCASDKRACNDHEFKMARNNSNIKKCKQSFNFSKYFKTRF